MAKASRETRNEKKKTKQNTEPDKRIHKRMQRTECRKWETEKEAEKGLSPSTGSWNQCIKSHTVQC